VLVATFGSLRLVCGRCRGYRLILWLCALAGGGIPCVLPSCRAFWYSYQRGARTFLPVRVLLFGGRSVCWRATCDTCRQRYSHAAGLQAAANRLCVRFVRGCMPLRNVILYKPAHAARHDRASVQAHLPPGFSGDVDRIAVTFDANVDIGLQPSPRTTTMRGYSVVGRTRLCHLGSCGSHSATLLTFGLAVSMPARMVRTNIFIVLFQLVPVTTAPVGAADTGRRAFSSQCRHACPRHHMFSRGFSSYSFFLYSLSSILHCHSSLLISAGMRCCTALLAVAVQPGGAGAYRHHSTNCTPGRTRRCCGSLLARSGQLARMVGILLLWRRTFSAGLDLGRTFPLLPRCGMPPVYHAGASGVSTDRLAGGSLLGRARRRGPRALSNGMRSCRTWLPGGRRR